MLKKLVFALFLVSAFNAVAQKPKSKPEPAAKPKLVIGIVIDQMRYDFLYRFSENYSDSGFKRMINEGYTFENMHYNYVPTYTAPGHASIYTGTTPMVNGIIGNNWFDRDEEKMIYCVADPESNSVGTTSKEGKMSPHRLLSTTIGDELKMFNNGASRVFALSIKDRGAVLPGGHYANAAYWYDGATGNMISSDFYMKELPQWVNNFNNRKLADMYLDKVWNLSLANEKYWRSFPDDVTYEGSYDGGKPIFPYDLKKLRGNDFSLLRSTPFGSDYINEFTQALIRSENLGKGNATDFLAVSYSSPDYIGHQFGPTSMEVEDTYIKLDEKISKLLSFIDEWIGKENVLIFLTADHGASYNPDYLNERNIPGGFSNDKAIADTVRVLLNQKFGEKKWLHSYYNQQLFLDHKLIAESKYSVKEFEDYLIEKLRFYPEIQEIIGGSSLRVNEYKYPPFNMVQAGYNHKRSGDVVINLEPAWMERSSKKGTTHGSGYTYDTHVPMLWYGWKVKSGHTNVKTEISDIAPTLSGILQIAQPNGSTGTPMAIPFH